MQKEKVKIANTNDFQKRAIRHGELMLVPLADQELDAEEIFNGSEYVCAHSESGHHHVAVGDVTAFRPVGADDGSLILRVNKDSRVEHRKAFDRHETKTLFKGLYRITIKRTYDYFAKRMEAVQD